MAYETAAQSVKQTTAASAIAAFDPLLGRLSNLVDRISQSADKVTGGRPSGVDGQKDAPTPQHLIAQIQERHQRLSALVDHLESEATRLDNGLS